jgi:hypothetical protein
MTDTLVIQCHCSGDCDRVLSVPNVVLGRTCREVWHYDEVHKAKPKWLKSKDGNTRVRYDSSKHGSHRGCEFHRKAPKPRSDVTFMSSESSEDN